MLRYNGLLNSYALRYLEFEQFDEKQFLESFVDYLRTVFYNDTFAVRDTGRRKAPDGTLRPKFEICMQGVPIFEIVSNTATSCFVGATRRAKGLHLGSIDGVLDAFLHHYNQPKEYLELSF